MSSQNKIALYAVLVALAMVFSWIEAQIPYPIPGAKIGLSNLVVLVALYHMGAKDALFINLIRILFVALTFGNMFAFFYSLAGGFLSCLIMIGMKKTGKFHVVAVSIAGGIAHNIGQIAVAVYVLETRAMIAYLPVLWIAGLTAGIITGLLGAVLIRRLPKKMFQK